MYINRLNKSDTLDNPREWPPEEKAKKAGIITDLLNYMTDEVLCCKHSNIDLNYLYRGYKIESNYDPITITLFILIIFLN